MLKREFSLHHVNNANDEKSSHNNEETNNKKRKKHNENDDTINSSSDHDRNVSEKVQSSSCATSSSFILLSHIADDLILHLVCEFLENDHRTQFSLLSSCSRFRNIILHQSSFPMHAIRALLQLRDFMQAPEFNHQQQQEQAPPICHPNDFALGFLYRLEGALRHHTYGFYLQEPSHRIEELLQEKSSHSTMEPSYKDGLKKWLKNSQDPSIEKLSSWNEALWEIEGFHCVQGHNVSYTCCDVLLVQETSSSSVQPPPIRMTQYYFYFVNEDGYNLIRYHLSCENKVLISIKGTFKDSYCAAFIPDFEELKNQTVIGSKLTCMQFLNLLLMVGGMTDIPDKICELFQKKLIAHENLLKLLEKEQQEQLEAEKQAATKEMNESVQDLFENNHEEEEEEEGEEEEEEDEDDEEEEDDSEKVKEKWLWAIRGKPGKQRADELLKLVNPHIFLDHHHHRNNNQSVASALNQKTSTFTQCKLDILRMLVRKVRFLCSQQADTDTVSKLAYSRTESLIAERILSCGPYYEDSIFDRHPRAQYALVRLECTFKGALITEKESKKSIVDVTPTLSSPPIRVVYSLECFFGTDGSVEFADLQLKAIRGRTTLSLYSQDSESTNSSDYGYSVNYKLQEFAKWIGWGDKENMKHILKPQAILRTMLKYVMKHGRAFRLNHKMKQGVQGFKTTPWKKYLNLMSYLDSIESTGDIFW
ncbi:hypothetical protein C9374_010463 [Naegleria lovaniensis]|uniref:Uncharacterized protein n=1 Tax=Naegleria lovaniensis TaxID=51637 RepID=A0AA88KFR0_NAELO|nr:uncharacterized protein C9374_010463 [Naegleria lovaniensis]KAG2374719.1 hypothetical protein C9374_010463 [Naegleria lovaniensis]